MNILWLINVALPEASQLMDEAPTPFGGWLVNASRSLSEQSDRMLSVAFPKKGIESFLILEGNTMKYYAFKPALEQNITDNYCDLNFEEILEETKPDIVHIFGTECLHALLMINICNHKNIKTVISIQGLVSIYARHYMASVPERVQRRFTFRDFIKRDNLKQQQKKFINMGKFEMKAIQRVKHVIGRTSWDRACTTQINPDVQYHFCNETLRDEFYKHTWDINQCEKFSIFVSQASYPIKGLHFMLEAMSFVLKRFPNAKLYIAGPDITKFDTLKEKLKKSSYSQYIIELIQKYNLEDKVAFTGLLDEKQMCERYLNSNVFVCPSSIENSPNSLGEAMILGVPCVASDVGGVSDLLTHKEEGFVYQSDAPYMLAYYLCELFSKHELALCFSHNAREHALKTHNIEENLKALINIYQEI